MKFVFVLVVASVLATQTQFRSGTDIVEVHATVKLKNGTIAHDLGRDDFELFEDGKRREIAVFSGSVQPLSIAIVLDRSGSTSSEFSNVQMASQEFVGRLLRADRTAISTLTWDCQPFTDDSRQLMTVLRMTLPTDWGSPIWAATDRAMSSLAVEGGRRVVLLFSDGMDTHGAASAAQPFPPSSSRVNPPSAGLTPCQFVQTKQRRTITDVVKRAEQDAVMVYTVSVETSQLSGSLGLDGSGDLSRLAKQSGGSFQRLKDYSELRSAFKSIADELHLQYLLGFVPTAFDGKHHKIEVRAKRSGVTVQARKGYTAQKAK